MDERISNMFKIPSLIYDKEFYGKNNLIIPSIPQVNDKELKEIPHFIPSKKKSVSDSNIPKKIFQTWKTRFLTEKMYNHVRKLVDNNPEYDYYLFGDYECREYLKRYYTPEYLQAFDEVIPGAFKADFWRYAVLYREGGVYVDIDLDILHPLDFCISKDTDFISIKDINSYKHSNAIFQAFIATIPKYIFLQRTLQLCLSNIQKNYYNDYITLGITGPVMMGEAMNCALGKDLGDPFEFGEYEYRNSKYKLFLFCSETGDINNEKGVKVMIHKIDDYVPISSYATLTKERKIYKSQLSASYFEKYKNIFFDVLIIGIVFVLFLKMKN